MPRPSRAARVRPRKRSVACAMLLSGGMKPAFLLAFLALGPALANLVPVADPVVEAETADAITGQTQHPAAANVSEAERAWLCGR